MASSTNNLDRTEKLGITLPVKLLQKIDSKRGAVESYLKGR
jgi:hypothetical protein